LIDNHLLHRRSSHDVPISEAWVRDYVTQEAVRAAKTTSSSVRKLFAPPFLVFTVVGLNMAKDAGEFDFFELKEIYGFRALTRMALPNPFGIEPPQTTQEACQERACNRTVTPQMIQSRLQRVAERKHEMQSLIQAFEIQEMRRRANNFF